MERPMAPIEREQQTQQQRPEHEAGGEVRDPVVAEVIRREDTVRDLDAPQDVQPTSPTRGDPRVRHEEVHRCAVDQHRLDRVARRVAHPETPVRTPAAVEEAVVVQARCGSRERQLHRSGEVEAAFGQGRQDQVRPLEAMPMPARSGPAEGKDAIDDLLQLCGGAIAQRRKIGDHPDIPELCRNSRVGSNREDVPKQW